MNTSTSTKYEYVKCTVLKTYIRIAVPADVHFLPRFTSDAAHPTGASAVAVIVEPQPVVLSAVPFHKGQTRNGRPNVQRVDDPYPLGGRLNVNMKLHIWGIFEQNFVIFMFL